MTQLDKLMAVCEGATPGPWSIDLYDCGDKDWRSGMPSIQAPEDLDCAIVHWDGFAQQYWRSARGDKEIHANAAFIATFNPTLVKALLGAVGALERAADSLAHGAEAHGCFALRSAETEARQALSHLTAAMAGEEP